MPIGDFYDVTWGSVRLWCARITTDNSRTQVIHRPAEGDDSTIQDRGLDTLKTTCELLFVEMPGEERSPLQRFLGFKGQVDEGARLLFVHPIDGAYYVNVEGFTYTIDEDSNFSDCSATFLKSAEADSPTPAGSGTDIGTGADAVLARSAELNAELEDSPITGLSSDPKLIGTDALAAIDAWSLPDVTPTRQVIVDIAGLSDRLATFMVEADLENDLGLFGVYRATIMLGASIRAAALAALADTPKLTSILVGDPISVLALCVRVYGGREAPDRARQVLALNDIRTPGWIASGTVLTIPVPPRARQRAA